MVSDSRPLLGAPTSSRGRTAGCGTVAVGLLLMCGIAILSEPSRATAPRESQVTEAAAFAAQSSQSSGSGSWADWWNSVEEVASHKLDEAEQVRERIAKNASPEAKMAEDWLDKKAAQVEKTNWTQVSKNVSQKAEIAEDWLHKKAEQVEKTNWSQVSKNVSQKAKVAEDWLHKKAEQVENTNWTHVQGTMSDDTHRFLQNSEEARKHPERLWHHVEGLTVDQTERLHDDISTYKARVQHPQDGDIQIDWSCADKVLVGAGLIAGATQVTVFELVPAFFRILGFAAEGVTADSLAAKWQSSIGNVEKGSLFAILQSIAMAGISSESYVLVEATAADVGVSSAVPILEKVCNPQEIHVIGSGDPETASQRTSS
eukprot:s498_g9.t1